MNNIITLNKVLSDKHEGDEKQLEVIFTEEPRILVIINRQPPGMIMMRSVFDPNAGRD